MNNTIRAAAVQMDVHIGEHERNLQRVHEGLNEAAQNGAKLVVFPECALSGYCFSSLGEAKLAAIPAKHSYSSFPFWCANLDTVGVIGYIESNPEGSQCYNSALVAWRGGISEFQPQSKGCFPAPNETDASHLREPVGENAQYVAYDSVEKHYRKSHLPILGFDRFSTAGDDLEVFDSPIGRLGVLICYDIRFPEAARVLGLKGADIIALPTNWPEGAESSPEFITRTRAWENRVYIVAANRVGVERGRRFIGRSQIVSPNGEIMVEAGSEEETIIYADMDLSIARQKRIIIEPGEWELDVIGGRRPDLYGKLVEPMP